jgi:L-lactate dehydrogenase complex protein LldE
MNTPARDVGLLVTCLVDAWRPSVGFAAVRLLERAGCRVSVPLAQTCCGQPAWNAGARREAGALARRVVETFEPFDFVVVPSGSCAGTVRRHYPALLADDPVMAGRARALAAKTWELVSFLTGVCGVEAVSADFAGSLTYHDGCSGLRELGIRDQPRRLLASMPGAELREHDAAETCCGFGGAFCVKYPDISTAMTDAKIESIERSGADAVAAGDLGCLLNIAGRLSRRGSRVAVRHVAEILAGMTDDPPIGGARRV